MSVATITDDLIVEHFARHPSGDDQFSDAINYPYTFLKGYRDAEAGIEINEPHWSMAEGNAYRLGRFEYNDRR
jgi:hypothetical protein